MSQTSQHGELADVNYLANPNEVERIKSEILDMVRSKSGVSFVELSGIEGFNGELGMEIRDNLFIWIGVSAEAVKAINKLMAANLIVMRDSDPIIYLADGIVLKIPVAKHVKSYETLHWYPVHFDPSAEMAVSK